MISVRTSPPFGRLGFPTHSLLLLDRFLPIAEIRTSHLSSNARRSPDTIGNGGGGFPVSKRDFQSEIDTLCRAGDGLWSVFGCKPLLMLPLGDADEGSNFHERQGFKWACSFPATNYSLTLRFGREIACNKSELN